MVTVVPSITGSASIGAGVGILLLIALVKLVALVFSVACKLVLVDIAEFTVLFNELIPDCYPEIIELFVAFCVTTGLKLEFNWNIVAFAASTAA